MHRRLAPLFLIAILAAACSGSKTSAPAEPVAPAPAGAGGRPHFTNFQLEDNHLVLPGPIVFAPDGADLDLDASAQALWFIHDYLEAKDYITLVRIEGHTDESGDDPLMRTGERALAVGRWLVSEGIDCNRLIAAAFGNSKPIADDSTADGRARNRRIEVVNATLRGKPIGGMPVEGSSAAAVPVCD